MVCFANNPSDKQLSLLKHMVRYYHHMATLGIKYQADCPNACMDNPDHLFSLKTYSNFAHGDNNKRKLSSGYFIFMASSIVSFVRVDEREDCGQLTI
jgi:hypothetical protein